MREKPFTKQQMKQTIAHGAILWFFFLASHLSEILELTSRGRFSVLINGAVYIFPFFLAFLVYQKRREYLKEKPTPKSEEPKDD